MLDCLKKTFSRPYMWKMLPSKSPSYSKQVETVKLWILTIPDSGLFGKGCVYFHKTFRFVFSHAISRNLTCLSDWRAEALSDSESDSISVVTGKFWFSTSLEKNRKRNTKKMATSFEEIVTDMRNDLVCRICESRARPGKTQWYRCLNLHRLCYSGYSICQDCKGKSEKCSCNGPISDGYLHIY